MSLSRRDFLKASGATAAGVATGGGIDLAPVEAAATSLRIKEAKVLRACVRTARSAVVS